MLLYTLFVDGNKQFLVKLQKSSRTDFSFPPENLILGFPLRMIYHVFHLINSQSKIFFI